MESSGIDKIGERSPSTEGSTGSRSGSSNSQHSISLNIKMFDEPPIAAKQQIQESSLILDEISKNSGMEAKECLTKVRFHIRNSKHIKVGVKREILEAVERLYQIAQEATIGPNDILDKGRMKDVDTRDGVEEIKVYKSMLIEEMEEQNRIMKENIEKQERLTKETEKILVRKLEENNNSIRETLKDNDKLVKDEINKLKEKIDKQEVAPHSDSNFKQEVITCVREEILKLKKELTTPKEPTYAQITASSPSVRRIETKHSIIITPKSPVNTKTELLEKCKKDVCFKELKFAPLKVIPITHQKLIIEFDRPEHRDEMLRKIDSSSEISATIVKKLKPMVVLKGINRQTEKSELVETLIKQNTEIADLNPNPDDVILKFITKNRNNLLYNAVLIVTPKIFNSIINKKRINIDYQKIHASEHIPLLQCFKCLQFGHTTKQCNNGEENCSHCASSDHTHRTCPHKHDSAKITCLNCKSHNTKYNLSNNTNHSATSSTCLRKKAAAERVQYNIEYELNQ